jgi:hypothetical protein
VTTSTDEVVQRYRERKKAAGPILARMAELRDAVNGDLIIPLPEIDKSERPAVANLIDQGLSQTASRIASTLPDVRFYPLTPGQDLSEKRAGERRKAVLSWWSMNRLNLIQRKRARFLVGYGSAPVMVWPDRKRRIPVWREMTPLNTFPPPGDHLEPDDCIFSFSRTLGWLRANYPDHTAGLRVGPDPRPDTVFHLLQYVDADEHVMLVLGVDQDNNQSWGGMAAGAPCVELERFPNRAGICTAVVPGRITLDRRAGQFDSLIGLYWTQAKLMALETIAVERSIFPDEWLISRQNETAQIVTMADGLRGEIGQVQGGDITQHNIQPGVQTYPTIDRIERAMRLSGGIPAEMGGESGQNIRTARRGAQVLSSAVDFPIQEAQEVLAAALQAENVRAIAIDKAYFGTGSRSFYYSWNGKRGTVDYDPVKTWETDEHVVQYAYPGSDINQVTVGTGQRIGMGTMSKMTGMRIAPYIDDPDGEHDQIIVEGLEAAQLQSLQAQAVDPNSPLTPVDFARIIELVREKDMPLYKVVIQVHKEAQERQATTGAPGTPAAPALPGSPEAMPGLAPPGMGAEAGVPAVEPQPASLGNLSGLLRSLHTAGRGAA